MITKSPDSPIAYGATAEIFAWEKGTILKLFREGYSMGRVNQEAHITQTVCEAGLAIPAVKDTIEINGRFGLVYERVEGEMMTDSIKRKPWQLFRLGSLLAELQAEIHNHTVPALPTQLDWLRDKITHGQALPANLQTSILKRLETLPDGDQLCHGDFHPLNIILASQGPVVIDWNNAFRGHPAGDAARTFLLLTAGDPPPQMALGWLFKLIRTNFCNRYARRYAQLKPEVWSQVSDWLPVVAAARMNDGIPDPQGRMLAIVKDASTE